MRVLILYLQQRFPIAPLLLYTIFTSIGINRAFGRYDIEKITILGIIYLLFLLHLRILDEFKDFAYDNTQHIERPVQKGIINLNALKKIGIINLIIITFLSLFISDKKNLIFLIFAMSYTTLMYKEFFIKKYLKRKIVLYLFLHQLVLIPLFLFFFSVFHQNIWFPSNISQISHFIYIILPLVLIEIGRKLKHRYNQWGEKTNDTYAYIWGEKKALQIFAGIILFTSCMSFNISFIDKNVTVILSLISATIIIGSYLFLSFLIKKSMILTSLLGLLIPLLLLL